MHIRWFFFCWPLLAGAVQAAEKPEAVADPKPSDKVWSLPALAPDPTQRAAIEKALEKSVHNPHLLRDTKDKTLIEAFLQIDKPPADMAFDVSLRSSDRTWRVGPMAWKTGDIQWWAYNVDLPETVTHVDFVFTPSARAGMIMSRFPLFPLKGLTSIWSGEPIVVSNVEIRSQDISMMKLRPPGDGEPREHLIDALPPESNWARQVADGMTLGEMRKRLDAQTAIPNPTAEVQFNLGCVMVAQGKLDEGMTTLLKARGGVGFDDRLQHELRYICARWIDAADKGNVSEMFFLGRAYEEGNGVGRDAQQAKYWYRKAANAGHAESKARLAVMKPIFPDAAESAAKTLAEYETQAAAWHKKSTTTYQEWVDRYGHKSFQAVSFDGKTTDLKVLITFVEDEYDGVPEEDIQSRQTRYETQLFADGTSRSSRYTSRGTSGGGNGSPLPADALAHIDQLIARLPDDHGILPAVNRRFMIETANKLERHVHVYDLADAPPEVEELMHVLNAGSAYVPQFQPFSSIHVRGYEYDGALAVTPQNEILYMGRESRLQWWDPATHEFIAEADVTDVKDIVLAPDKVHALVQSSSGTVLIDLPGRKPVRIFKDRFKAQFTQDGRQVLLYKHKAPVQIVDTRSWQSVDHTDDVSNDCTSFIPAPAIHRALVRASDGSVALWDTAAHRAIAQLDSGSDVNLFAVFSPDESLVAVCAHPWNANSNNTTPIEIYSSDDGTKLQGLGSLYENLQSLLWTSDGQYVLVAGGNSSGTGTISIFNTANGKCRGVLTGPSRINGIGLLSKLGELVAGDQNGTIWFWDLSVVMDRIREFEVSLTSAEK